MATAFPGGLDSFTNPVPTNPLDSVTVPHAGQHDNLNDAVAALEAKVGVNGSAVTSSLDYKVANISAVRTYDPGWNGGATVSSNAFKGCLFTPGANMTVVESTVQMSSVTASAVYKAMVVTLTSNSPGATTIATVLGSSDSLTLNASPATGPSKLAFKWSTPVSLVSGTTYGLLVGCTNNSGTYVMPIAVSQDAGSPQSIASVPGTLGLSLTCSVASPIATSAITVVAQSGLRFAPGFTVTVP